MKNALQRTSIVLLGLLFIVLPRAEAAGAETRDPKPPIRLEDDRYLVEASGSNGSIVRILDRKGGLDLLREPRLADSFRFSLPIPGKEPWQTIEANYLWGKDQKLSSVDAAARRLTLRWNKPLVNYLGEKFEASAAMGIELTPDGILFNLRIDNQTPYGIGEVFFPQLGGLQGIGKTAEQLKATRLVRPTGADAVASADIFRVFGNMSWLGDQGAEQVYGYPKDVPQPWMELYAPQANRSVRLGADNRDGRPRVLRLELIPGNSATVREDGNWPRPDELRGQPVGVSVCFVDFANAPANKTYEAASVQISFHDGDWHEMKKIRNASRPLR